MFSPNTLCSPSGLENIHLLTQRKKYELRVDLEDFEGAKVHVQYSSFSVDSEHEGYKLHLSGFKDGGAGESKEHFHFSSFPVKQQYYQSETWSIQSEESYTVNGNVEQSLLHFRKIYG
jgi:hypothetical protein